MRLKPDGEITIGFHIAVWAEIGMANEVHCDDGDILSKGAGKSQIVISGFTREETNGGTKGKSYIRGIRIAWYSAGSLTVETSTYEGEIQAASRGFDSSRFLKSMSDELLFGNGNYMLKREFVTIMPAL